MYRFSCFVSLEKPVRQEYYKLIELYKCNLNKTESVRGQTPQGWLMPGIN